MDGLVYPDRRPHTGLLEYKNVYRPARVTHFDQDRGQLTLHNYLDFLDLKDWISISFQIDRDGRVIDSDERKDLPSIPPHGEGTVPFVIAVPQTGKCFLKITYQLKRDAGILKQGEILGFDEIPLKNRDSRNQYAAVLLNYGVETGNEIKVQETDRRLIWKMNFFIMNTAN